jgi:hypothetical protein
MEALSSENCFWKVLKVVCKYKSEEYIFYDSRRTSQYTNIVKSTAHKNSLQNDPFLGYLNMSTISIPINAVKFGNKNSIPFLNCINFLTIT